MSLAIASTASRFVNSHEVVPVRVSCFPARSGLVIAELDAVPSGSVGRAREKRATACRG